MDRTKMCELSRLPVQEVTEILSKIARVIRRVGWEFLLPYDSGFLTSFPDVVQRQSMIWEAKSTHRKQTELKVKEEEEDGGESPNSSQSSLILERRASGNKSSDNESGSESEFKVPKTRRNSTGRRRNSFSDTG